MFIFISVVRAPDLMYSRTTIIYIHHYSSVKAINFLLIISVFILYLTLFALISYNKIAIGDNKRLNHCPKHSRSHLASAREL